MIGNPPISARFANVTEQLQSMLPQPLQRLTSTQQAIVAAGAVGTIVALVALAVWAQRPEYAPLYTGLSPEDAGAVTSRLRDAKTPYELTDGGSTILVARNQVYDTRLTMASQGLPTGGRVGFEIFDKTNFGVPEFVQQLNFQRALEGELERTIGQIAGVDKATVHLVMPKTELFSEQQRETTASVTLKLTPNTRMQPGQVAAIRHLVASSVAGLQPKKIVIADTGGNLLLDGAPAETSTSAINSQMDAKRSYERGVEQAVTAILTQTLGPEKAVVRANAIMNWDQVEANAETFSPGGAAPQPRSMQQTQESFSGQGLPPEGGIPGTTTNVPPVYTGVGGGQGPTDYSRQQVTTNFELSKVIEKRTPAPGALQRLSVAVMVPDSVPDTQIQSLSSLVAAAAGIDTARGDTVSVAALPLDTSAKDAAEQATRDAQQHELEMTGLKIGGALLAILIFFLGMRFIAGGVGRRGAVPVTTIVEPRAPGDTSMPALTGTEGAEGQLPGASQGEGGPALLPSLPPSMEEQKRVEAERIRQENEARMAEQRASQLAELQELAKTDPQRVAEVVQIWLADDRRGGR